VILILCVLMSGHVIQVWVLYIKSKKEKNNQPIAIPNEEMEILKSSNDI
jgi:hypothetical protein